MGTVETGILRRAFDDFVTDGVVHDPKVMRVLEKDRGTFRVDFFSVRQGGEIDGDWPNLATGYRKLGGVFSKAQCP